MSERILHVYSRLKGHFDIHYDADSVMEGCDEITEHQPRGEVDKWFYDVKKGDRVFRLFDVEVATRSDT